jgi:hypothetical protein
MEPEAVTKLYFLLVVNSFLCAFYLSFLSYLFFIIPIAIIACGYFISLRQKWHSVLCLAFVVTGSVSGLVALFLFSSVSICRLLKLILFSDWTKGWKTEESSIDCGQEQNIFLFKIIRDRATSNFIYIYIYMTTKPAHAHKYKNYPKL